MNDKEMCSSIMTDTQP